MLSFGMSEARAGSPMRARSERRPRRRALSRDARGDSQLCLPLPTAAAASISPVTSSTPECDDSPPSPPPQPSSGDLRWLLDLDLTCYSIFALCLVISAFATRERHARLLSLAIAAACALFAAAAAPLARRGCSRRRRDLTAFAFRALFAAAINPIMAGGLPRGGRLVGAFFRRPHGAREHALLGPDSEAPVGLSHGVAVAQTALLFRGQRPACEAVLVGYVGIGEYYSRMQGFIDRALSASSWLQQAVAVEGRGAKALTAPADNSSSSLRSSASSSASEAGACVAVMTELQIVAALVLLAFGTMPPGPGKEEAAGEGGEREAEEEEDDGDRSGAGVGVGERRRQKPRRHQR